MLKNGKSLLIKYQSLCYIYCSYCYHKDLRLWLLQLYTTQREQDRERDLSYSNSVLFIFGAIGGAESDTKHSAAGASSGGNSHLLNPPRPDLILLHQHSLYSFSMMHKVNVTINLYM